MDSKILKNSFPYLVIAGTAYFMFRGIFALGFMSGCDNSFHYYDAYYLVNTLIPEYHRISGWGMQHLAGFPVFVDYYQTGFWAIAILNKALFLPLDFSYKLMVLASYIVLGAGFYKLTSYRFGKAPALTTAICLMLQKDIYYGRILGGMWSNYLAIGLFFIFFHVLDKNSERLRLKKALILGLLLAGIILTHLYAAIAACVLWVIYAGPNLFKAIKRKTFKEALPYVFIPGTGLAISLCYLYGFIVGSAYFRKLASKPLTEGLIWGFKSFFGPLESINSVSNLFINVPVMMRIIFSIFAIYVFITNCRKNYKNKKFLIYTGIFTIVFLVFFADVANFIKIPLIVTLQISRFLIYPQLGFYVFAAYGLSEIFKKKQILVSMCAVLIPLSIFFHHRDIASHATQTLDQSPQMPNVHKVWNWIDENISPGDERIVYQNTVSNTDDPIFNRSDVFALSGVFTKVPQIGVSRSASPFPQEVYMRNDRGNIFGKPIDDVGELYIRDIMNEFNAGHIVSVEPELENKLDKSQLFSKEKTYGIFNIFRMNGFKSAWIDFKRDAEYEALEIGDQSVTARLRNGHDGNEALIKVAYHPMWRGWLNEKPVRVGQGDYGLIKIPLPEKGNFHLKLLFNPFNTFFASLSLLSLVATIVGITCAGSVRK